MAAQVQANDEVDADLDQVLQQLQVAELAVEHQRLVTQERLDLVKGLPMVLVARTRQLGDRLGGIGDKAAGQRPATIGRRQQQQPEAAGLAILERADIAGLAGLRPRHLGRIANDKRRIGLEQAQQRRLRIGLLQETLDHLVVGRLAAGHVLRDLRQARRTAPPEWLRR